MTLQRDNNKIWFNGINYDPFGMITVGRNWEVGSEYRYGFQGQESNFMTYGENNLISFCYRFTDTRLGRFFSVDPIAVKYPFNSPYSFSENCLIACFELEGLESHLAINIGPDVDYRGEKLNSIIPLVTNTETIPTSTKVTPLFIDILKEQSMNEPVGVGFLAVFSHGYGGQAIFAQNSYAYSMYISDLNDLDKAIKSGEIKFTDGAVIYLGGCNTGILCSDFFSDQVGGTPIEFAQRLADITGATVIAATDQVGPLEESQGNLTYTIGQPGKEGNGFYEFKKGNKKQFLGATIDVVKIATWAIERNTPLPEKIITGKINTIPTTSSSEIKIKN